MDQSSHFVGELITCETSTMATPSSADGLWHLKNCPLFTDLPTDDITRIYAACQFQPLAKQQSLSADTGQSESLFIVKNGHVQLSYLSADGREAVVVLLGPGDLFGTIEGGMNEQFGQACRAVSDSCLLRISRVQLDQLLLKYPTLAYRLTKFSLLRISRLQVRLAEMMMRQADQRLALALLDLDSQVGRSEPDGSRKLLLALTHADLAKLIGTTREFVTVILGRFRKDGLVKTDKGWIYLLDRDGLRRVSDKE